MIEKDIRVAIVQKSFASYRKAIFDLLSKRFSLKVIHCKMNLGLDEAEADYSEVVRKIKYAPKSTAIYIFCMGTIKRFKPDVIIHEFTPSILSLFTVFIYRKALGYKIILWGHIFSDSKQINQSSIKYIIRSKLINSADAILFYSKISRDRVLKFLPSNKYFVAQNSLETNKLNQFYSKHTSVGILKIKLDLSIPYEKNVIFIGRLLEDKIVTKQFIEIVNLVSSKIDNIGFYVIGDGPEKSNLSQSILDYKLRNVHLLGSIYDDELSSKYLFVSDLMLMPGAVGLAVNHAMAFNTPTVTFESSPNGPFHGPEASIIENNKTGYKARNNDIDDITSFIIRYFSDASLRSNMKSEITRMNEQFDSLGNMEKGFLDAINYCLNND